MLTLLKWGHARNEFTEEYIRCQWLRRWGSHGPCWRVSFHAVLMKLVWVGIIEHLWFLPMTRTLTTLSLFMLLQQIWLTMNDALIFQENWGWPGKNVQRSRRSRRPTSESHTMEEMTVIFSPQQHHHHGDQDTEECILLREEDGTRRFLLQFFNWQFVSWSRMVCTFARKRWYHLRVQSSLFCEWYILFVSRENIIASPNLSEQTTQLPNFDFCPLITWMCDFGIPIPFLLCAKEFGSRLRFSIRHVLRTDVISHRQRPPSRFGTATAAHSPLFC